MTGVGWALAVAVAVIVAVKWTVPALRRRRDWLLDPAMVGLFVLYPLLDLPAWVGGAFVAVVVLAVLAALADWVLELRGFWRWHKGREAERREAGR